MPFITAREDAGLSQTPSSQDIDAIITSGQKLAIDWVQKQDKGASLGQVRLAGNYTCPDSRNVLRVGDLRYINLTRFDIPEDAWLAQSATQDKPGVHQAASLSSTTGSAQAQQGMIPPEVAAINHYFEGCRLEAYPDPRTKSLPITIGWGSTFYEDMKPIQLGDRISQERADKLYEFNCYHRFWTVLEANVPFWHEMSSKQQAALCSFAYNMGADFYGSNGCDTISRNLRERNWIAVPGSLMMYRNRNENVEVGLGRRRRAEGLLWIGVNPIDACKRASQDIQVPADCEHFEKELKANPPKLVEDSTPATGLQLAITASGPKTPLSHSPPTPMNAPVGLDPRGSEEQGLIGPKMRAPVKPGDSYLLVNDRDQDMEAYDHTGSFLWRIPCLGRGQYGDNQWNIKKSDTPPGLYKIGTIYRDYENDPSPQCSDTAMAYGWYSFDLVELEDQEKKVGRAGVMIHGGGSNCGWPGAWEPQQKLCPTHGCVRVHNIDLKDKILPLALQGTVYVGVFQEP